MHFHTVLRLARLKRLALAIMLFSVFGATMRCLAAPTLSLLPPSWTQVAVVQGASSTADFNVAASNSFQGAVTFAVSGLPSGVTASWSQNPVSLNAEAGSSTLTVSASASASTGTTTFTVTASGDGVSVSQRYHLLVQQAPGVQLTASHQSMSIWSMSSHTLVVTATPLGGVTVPSGAAGATPAVSGLPVGITGSWSSPTVNSGAVSWTLTLTGSVYAVASSETLTLSAQITDANSGNVYSATLGMPLTVSFQPPTLNFSPVVDHMFVIQGGQVTDLFTFTGGGSFHSYVNLTVTGLPSFLNSWWSGNPVPLLPGTATSTLTIVPSATATPGWYPFTVTATGDGLTVSSNYSVAVEPSAGMQAQLSASAVTVQPNGMATLTVTAQPINGILLPSGAAGASAAVASGLPSGVSASWSGPTATAAGAAAWTLTLTADNTAQTGSNVIGLSVQITDATSGLVYSANPSFTLLTSLLATVSIGSTPISTIPVDFMGLSHEWNDAQFQMGSSATGVNTIYRQLLSNLTQYGGGPINVRVGGNSTDATGEPTSTTVEPFIELANDMGSQFELGVNLGADNASLAVDQAVNYSSNMPAGSLLALEVGNEPDLYPTNGLRPSTYAFQDYLQDFGVWVQNITPVLPQGMALAGPAGGVFVNPPSSEAANVQSFLTAESSSLSMFTQHYYSASPSDNPAPDFLLTPAAATAGPAWVAPAVQAAHADGLPFRMDEIGAVSNGGVDGVSDNFASALYAIDTMFNYASVGVDGVNWEASNGNYNEPFYFNSATSNGVATYTLSDVNPVYYGLIFFQKAIADGAQMLPVNLVTPANLTAWATAPTARLPRVSIINKDETQSGNVLVSMPGFNKVTVIRLLAPSYTSTNGITFAGQTMDGSSDGTMQGNRVGQTILGSGGVFQIPMPVTSAAIVTFSNQ